MAASSGRMLVSTEWLADHLSGAGRDFALVDAAEAAAYRRAHIPGAVGLSTPFLKGADNPRLVMPAEEFEPLAGSLGIANDTPVVVYDDNGSLSAARVWWAFEHFGHRDVRVVDGGFNAWLDEGRPLTAEQPRPQPAQFTAHVDDTALCTLGELREIVEGSQGRQLWDTRSAAEWTGENDRGNRRVGHLPGARHLEWSDLMQGPPARRFRPVEEIRALLERAGIDPEAETVTY